MPGGLTPTELFACLARRCRRGEDLPRQPGWPWLPEGSARTVPRHRRGAVRRCRPRRRRGVAAAGAAAVSVGGPLLGDALRGGDLDALRDRATGVRGGLRAGDDVSARVVTVGETMALMRTPRHRFAAARLGHGPRHRRRREQRGNRTAPLGRRRHVAGPGRRRLRWASGSPARSGPRASTSAESSIPTPRPG